MKKISIGLFVALLVGLSVFASLAPAPGQKSVAIIYASRYGSTAQTAELIAAGMDGNAAVVSVSNVKDLNGYKNVILGSGIYFGDLHPDMTAFLEKRGEEIRNKVVAVFVVCGAPPDQAGGYLDMLAGKCQAKPLLAQAFNGWLKKELLSPEDFASLEKYYKSIKQPFENYDHTDKAECLAFGKEVLEKIRVRKQDAPYLKILPEAVISAFTAAYPKAVIKGASKEKEKGVIYYEVESADGKLNRDLLYTADGKAVEIEEAVAPESLPAAVHQALGMAYPGHTILKAEALTKGTQKMFELQIRVTGKKHQVTIDSSGKIMK